jgi:hypothetical protein
LNEIFGSRSQPFRWPSNLVPVVCSGTSASQAFVSSGNVDTWTSCAGKRVLERVSGAEHGVAAIDAQMGSSSSLDVMNAVVAFLSGF